MNRIKILRFKIFLVFIFISIFVLFSHSADNQVEQNLLAAVQSNKLDKVGEILNSGEVKNINEVDGQSLLRIAFDIYAFNVARSLLQNGAEPNVKVNYLGQNITLTEYLVHQSKNDKVGFGAVKLRMLLDNHADFTQTSSPKIDIFNIILNDQIIPLASKGDLLFTSWLYLLQDIFKSICFEKGEFSVLNLEDCSNYIANIKLFLQQAKRDQVVELNMGNITPFIKTFDLCPNNDDLLLPGVSGCNSPKIIIPE